MPGEQRSSVQEPPSLVGILTQPSSGSHSFTLQRSASSSGQVTSPPPEHRPSMQIAPWKQAEALQSVPFSATTHTFPEQVWQVAQVLPHSSTVPHSVGTSPHLPSQVMAVVQAQMPSAVHVSGSWQVPHSSTFPHSSVMLPHTRPVEAQVVDATQMQMFWAHPSPGPQSPSVQHCPGARQAPLQTICPVGQQSSSP